jgi:peptidoglycan/xylan/chitin deacetylase (PgdA/CDA1 family)
MPACPLRGAWRLVAAMVLCGLRAATASAAPAPATQIIFTVDVESKGDLRLPRQYDAVCDDGSRCGLAEIVRRLRSHGWAATLFLNVYEHRQLGDAAMRDIAVRLEAAGQDVQLHTHPDAAYDPARPSMHQYTLDEQTAIVRDGMRLLQGWTGRPVVAHRAGAYAADERTLLALERNGIPIDSSVFWKDANSRLDGLGLARNLPTQRGRLLEIPVTVYEREDRPRIIGSLVAPTTTVRKIDPNWLADVREMKDAVDEALEARVPYLVVFLHSFSLIERDAAGIAVADHRASEMFDALLEHLAGKHLPVVTMREVADSGAAPVITTADVVPRVRVSVDLGRYAWRRAKAAGGVTRRVYGAFTVAVLAGAAVLVLARRRRAAERSGALSPAPTGAQ